MIETDCFAENPLLCIRRRGDEGWGWYFVYKGVAYSGGPYQDSKDAGDEMASKLEEVRTERKSR